MMQPRRITAWIAIAAMLFGAVSPALAAALFADHAEMLRRMLAIPAAQGHAVSQAASADHDGCPHETPAADDALHSHAHHDAGAGSHETPEHAAHGIFCSFCLTASSTLTLLAAAPTIAGIAPVISPSPGGHEREPASPQPASHRSRAPPSL